MADYTDHKDYKTCNHCGANIDHGERCDCRYPKCKECGAILKWGGFAHNQEVCWKCYKNICATAIQKLGNEEERQFLTHAMKMVAEFFKEEY